MLQFQEYIRNPLFPVTDCESLVRKILVRDPARRFTLEAIKRHRWMRAEVPKSVRTEQARTSLMC